MTIADPYRTNAQTALAPCLYSTAWLRVLVREWALSIEAGFAAMPFTYGADEAPGVSSGYPRVGDLAPATLARTNAFFSGNVVPPMPGPGRLVFICRGVAVRVLPPRVMNPGAVERPAWLRPVARAVRDAMAEVATLALGWEDAPGDEYPFGPLEMLPYLGADPPDRRAAASASVPRAFAPSATPFVLGRRDADGLGGWMFAVRTEREAHVECEGARGAFNGDLMVPVRVCLFGEQADPTQRFEETSPP